MEREVIYVHNTRISFGAGATHFSIEKAGGKYEFFEGVPQVPRLVKICKVTESNAKTVERMCKCEVTHLWENNRFKKKTRIFTLRMT